MVRTDCNCGSSIVGHVKRCANCLATVSNVPCGAKKARTLMRSLLQCPFNAVLGAIHKLLLESVVQVSKALHTVM